MDKKLGFEPVCRQYLWMAEYARNVEGNGGHDGSNDAFGQCQHIGPIVSRRNRHGQIVDKVWPRREINHYDSRFGDLVSFLLDMRCGAQIPVGFRITHTTGGSGSYK